MTSDYPQRRETSDTQFSDARACEQLSYAYARCLDFFDHDALPELFTLDAELTLDGESVHGREAILAHMANQPRHPTRHVISNVFIDFIDATNARGIAYVQRLSPSNSQLAHTVGHFEDRYIRSSGEWLFARRKLHWLRRP